MPKLTFNASKSKFTLLPEGTYDLRINDIDVTTNKKDEQQLEVRCEVVGGPHDGAKLTNFYQVTDKMGWKLRNLLDACDVDYTLGDAAGQDPEVENIEFEQDDLIGAIYQCDVAHRAYEGKQYMNFNNERLSPLQAPANGNTTAAAQAPAAAAAPQTAAGAATGDDERRRRRRPVVQQ